MGALGYLPWELPVDRLEHPCLRDEPFDLTYREVDVWIDAASRHLHRAGVRPGTTVAVPAEVSALQLVAVHAAWRLRAAALVVDLRPDARNRPADAAGPVAGLAAVAGAAPVAGSEAGADRAAPTEPRAALAVAVVVTGEDGIPPVLRGLGPDGAEPVVLTRQALVAAAPPGAVPPVVHGAHDRALVVAPPDGAGGIVAAEARCWTNAELRALGSRRLRAQRPPGPVPQVTIGTDVSVEGPLATALAAFAAGGQVTVQPRCSLDLRRAGPAALGPRLPAGAA